MSIKILNDSQYPTLEISLNVFGPGPQRSLFQKVKIAVREVFRSLNYARREIQPGLTFTFKANVYQFYGYWSLPLEPGIYAYRIALWLAQNTYLFVETFFVDLYWKSIGSSLVTNSIGENLDHRHLRSSQGTFDGSSIPHEITIDTLMTFFMDINFENPAHPNYVDRTKFASFDRLKTIRGLNTFIEDIKNRVAKTGTPRQGDSGSLERFYQYIRDRVRQILHEFTKKADAFYDIHGKDPTKYSQGQKKEYQLLLEERVGLAIEFGEVGNWCGSRYTSETTVLWNTYCKRTPQGDLKNQLIEMLATFRTGIALQRIQTVAQQDTHFHNTYMASLGQELGLTVPKGITEHLPSSRFNASQETYEFFRQYTSEKIKTFIQEKIKDPKDAAFRDLIFDWAKSKRGEWLHWSKQEHSTLTDQLHQDLSTIIHSNSTDTSNKNSPRLEHAKKVLALISHLKTLNFSFGISEGAWENSIEDLFTGEQVKEWCQNNLSISETNTTEQVEILRKRNALKNYLIHELNEKEKELLRSFIKEGDLNPKISQDFLDLSSSEVLLGVKTKEFLAVLKKYNIQQPELDVIKRIISEQIHLKKEAKRIISEQTHLKEAICNLLNAEAEAKLIELLRLNELQETGLSDELLEVLLLEYHILTPQKNLQRRPYPLWKRVCLIHIPRILRSYPAFIVAGIACASIFLVAAKVQFLFLSTIQPIIKATFAGFRITALVAPYLPIIELIHLAGVSVIAAYFGIRGNSTQGWVILGNALAPYENEIMNICINTIQNFIKFFISRGNRVMNHLNAIENAAIQDYNKSLRPAK